MDTRVRGREQSKISISCAIFPAKFCLLAQEADGTVFQVSYFGLMGRAGATAANRKSYAGKE